MALPAELILALEELPAADQAVIGALLEVIDALSETTAALAEGLGMLNELDDKRARQVADLEVTVRILADAAGLETTGSPLAELIAQWTAPKPESMDASRPRCARCAEPATKAALFRSGGAWYHRECWQAELRELREIRQARGGDNG